jgi:hypothetical protein
LHLNVWLLSILLAITSFHLLFPDYVQFSPNLKWDGQNYIDYALHFPDAAFGQTVDLYRFQRIFPSGIVYYGLTLFHVPLTGHTVFKAFLGLNILLIFISFGIWLLLCKQIGLSRKGKLLSFTGIFINYALLKMPFYYPVLTDVMAFTLGMGLLYCYLRKNTFALLITGLIGAFTLPTIFYSALLLYVFPAEEEKSVPQQTYTPSNLWLVWLTVAGFFLLIIAFCFYKKVPLINPNPFLVLIISSLASLAYLYFATKVFYNTDLYLHNIKNFNNWKRAGAALIMLLTMYIVLRNGASNEPLHINYKGILANIVISSIANPLVFLVSHAMYFGPVFLLVLFFAKPFAEQISNYGLGLHVFTLGFILLSINAETRLFMNAWPFIVLFLCKTIDKLKLPLSFYLLIFLYALVLSKFWYRIQVPYFTEKYLNFPEQRYFMSQGPWMSDAMYVLQGTVVLVGYGWMYWFYLRKVSILNTK